MLMSPIKPEYSNSNNISNNNISNNSNNNSA